MGKQYLHPVSTSVFSAVLGLDITVAYCPPRPQVRWALKPHHIPPWDWTRGFGQATALLSPAQWGPEVERSHNIQPTPAGLSYPRLVRSDPHRVEYGPVTESALEALKELWPKLRRLEPGDLRTASNPFAAAIPRMVERLGVLDLWDQSGQDNTLRRWAGVVLKARFWQHVVSRLPTPLAWHDLTREALGGWAGWPLLKLIPLELQGLDLSTPTAGAAMGVHFLRSALSAGPLSPNPFSPSLVLEYRGGLAGWLDFELARLFLRGEERRCLECGKPLPEGTRGGVKYCSIRCRRNRHQREWRQRNRLST